MVYKNNKNIKIKSMNDATTKKRLELIEILVSFLISMAFVYLYLKYFIEEKEMFGFFMFGGFILSIVSIGLGGSYAQENKKNPIVYSLIVFFIGLLAWHFILYLPNS